MSGVEIQAVPDGCRIRLRVRAGAQRDRITGAHGGALKLMVSAAPEKGKANRAVRELLAETLGIPPSEILIASGETSPDKVIVIRGVPVEECARKLEAAGA